MRVVVIGSGGREHAIVHALARSETSTTIATCPGNAGTAMLGRNVPIAATAVDELVAFAREFRAELVIVGPEAPLVAGLADRLRDASIPVVGPSASASRLEGSKAWAKAFMARHGIPTAAYRAFERSQSDEAKAYVRTQGAPIVVKASGLAAGKGAVVCSTVDEAVDAIDQMCERGSLGSAADEIIIEECMQGEEASLFACTDGEDYVLLASAQDHKRLLDGDCGPNTGGMGAYGPAPVMTEELLDRARKLIIEPTLHGMASEGCPYSGFLYCGLMITESGPKVVEFNCRLGDPETQVVLPLLDSDPLKLFSAMADGSVGQLELTMKFGSAACVVMASGGYPGSYEKHKRICGLNDAAGLPGAIVYHAGIATESGGTFVTAGGRVLAVTGVGSDLGEAIETAYAGIDCISFEGHTYRRDIGAKGLARVSVE